MARRCIHELDIVSPIAEMIATDLDGDPVRVGPSAAGTVVYEASGSPWVQVEFVSEATGIPWAFLDAQRMDLRMVRPLERTSSFA